MHKNQRLNRNGIEVKNWFSVIRKWRHLSGFRNRKLINRQLTLASALPQVVEYTVHVSSKYGINGRKLFFFSDLHYTEESQNPDIYSELIAEIDPDWIVFGGDLITYACHFQGAFEWLGRVVMDFADIPKFAVPGNWDRRRGRWFPQHIWSQMYGDCGFYYLINHEIIVDGIRFYGVDELRGGHPVINSASFDDQYFNCVVSHSVESVIDFVNREPILGDNLMLCGHSHGGQIRIPFFGALLTSTKYWKLFEYGLYKTRRGNSELILTSGVGLSRLPFRIFCPPEVVVVRFVNNP